ncbi:MAG: hypothetical protein GY797_41370, partial [Deltaproteobacteria bacterium]|nr:hypothetical protein [Deltaproteobacteria bacterium]
GGQVPFSELEALARQLHEENEMLPETVKYQHYDYHMPRLLVSGQNGLERAPRQGQLVVSMEVEQELLQQIAELRYSVHMSRNHFSCDCQVLIELKMHGRREPKSTALRKLGRAFDGYFEGDYFVCEVCCTHWFLSEEHTPWESSYRWEPAGDTVRQSIQDTLLHWTLDKLRQLESQ